jgi:MarR family transcriptional regulator, organic hydroperoxide resistance regulator
MRLSRSTTKSSAAEEAWLLVLDLFATRKALLARTAAEYGLAPMQAFALRRLDPEAPTRMSDLAEVLACDASNVTGIVDRLEGRGLVERRADASDRRVKQLVLTEPGLAVRRELTARLDTPPPELTALSAPDQQHLRDLLARALGR